MKSGVKKGLTVLLAVLCVAEVVGIVGLGVGNRKSKKEA